MSKKKVMSLLFKPAGDELATQYGEYFDLAALSTISVGGRYEVLCSDGMNYIVEIKQFDPVSFIGHIHFRHWKTRFDFKGSIRDVYMTTEGRYSKDAGITASNTYETENVSQSARRSSQIGSRKLSLGEKSSYAANTKYDDDFFAKPRPKWAKRRRQAYESEMMPASYEERMSVGDSSSGEEDVVSRIQSKCRFGADIDHDLHLFYISAANHLMLLSQDKRRRINSQDMPDEEVAISIPNHALLQRFAAPLASSGRNSSDPRKEDKPHKAVGELPHILELKQSAAAAINIKKEDAVIEESVVGVGEVNITAVSAISSSSGNVAVVDMVDHAAEKQPEIDPSAISQTTSSSISPTQPEEAVTSKASVILEDIKTLVDTLELSYAVDETEKLIGIIRSKASNIPELGSTRKQIDMLLKLLQVKRNIDESITQLLDL